MGNKRNHDRRGEEGNCPIAKKLVAAITEQLHGKLVNLEDVIDGRAAAVEKQKAMVSKEGLADLHPAHAAYVFAQNQVSVISEQITALDEMAPFADMVSKAEDRYLPSGPPMSPLTSSYFTSWAFFDACVGAANETIGTCIIEVGTALGMGAELRRLIQQMQRSRMGLYVHDGKQGDLVTLREIVTGAVCRAIVPAGPRGQVGELWYVRVLPPPAPRHRRARRLLDALRPPRARPGRVAGVLPPCLARGPAARTPRRLRAPHEAATWPRAGTAAERSRSSSMPWRSLIWMPLRASTTL